MSRRIDTRYAAKRRAANKKRMRDLVRYIAIFGFIGILILGTVSTVLITNTSGVTVASATPTPTSNSSLASLVTQADTNIASGDYNSGISLYRAYLSQNSTDADVIFKLGQAYVDSKNPAPDYLAGVSYLQQALNASPSATWASEAQTLITQYAPQALAEATVTALAASASPVVTGTAATDIAPSITATTVITK
jgi:predicted Zn-dependent protease